MIDVDKLKIVSCRKCGTYTAFDKDVIGTRVTCAQCQFSFVAQEYVPPLGSRKNAASTNKESESSPADNLKQKHDSNSTFTPKDNPPTDEDDIYWSYDDFVSAYQKKEIQVFVNHPAICGLCDSVLEHVGDSGIAYRSSKLWFWLLPTLSLASFFVIGWFGIAVVLLAIGISLFKIGPDARRNAYDCIIEASLREPMVFRLLWGNEHLNIKKLIS